MNKYDVIKIEDYFVIVDNTEKPDEDELHISTKYAIPELHSHHWRNNEDSCHKIVATVGKKLNYFPLIDKDSIRNGEVEELSSIIERAENDLKELEELEQ